MNDQPAEPEPTQMSAREVYLRVGFMLLVLFSPCFCCGGVCYWQAPSKNYEYTRLQHDDLTIVIRVESKHYLDAYPGFRMTVIHKGVVVVNDCSLGTKLASAEERYVFNITDLGDGIVALTSKDAPSKVYYCFDTLNGVSRSEAIDAKLDKKGLQLTDFNSRIVNTPTTKSE